MAVYLISRLKGVLFQLYLAKLRSPKRPAHNTMRNQHRYSGSESFILVIVCIK